MLRIFPKLLLCLSALLLLVTAGWGNPIWANPAANGQSESSPAASIQAKALNKEVEQLYRHVEEGNVQAVLEDIRRVSGLFEASSFQGLTGVEGIHALAESILEMKEATARATQEPQHWMVSAGKLRMAADSLIHARDALWLQYYKVIREDLRVMGQYAQQQDQAGMRRAYDSLSEHYELIRPSVVIQRKPEDVNMMESWISYAGGLVASGDTAQVEKVVPQGEEMMNMLFGKKKDEPALAPLGEVKEPWTWQLVIAAFILAALTFAGYRKYRGQLYSAKPMFPRK
ncbi:MAG: sporulation protein YpjB [Paenibacillus lautus]|jgi:sporulation protein YpjB|uniref:sporulation protein YpjB n=1 Tax=Paenibacillus lautus TaxID=1401 RepID=UPI0026F22998|nr:sporulation protein YpjB [Paenibacillus lautus]MCI1774785.1 sporulation protein YpjB [Paenibacillus lautus]